MIPAPVDIGAEEAVVNSVLWLKLAVEAMGALVIGLGMVAAVVTFARAYMSPLVHDFDQVRLTLARYLALGLEFQLGADILSTAVAPSWDMIGKLGAIAVLRTALNYFLRREMEPEGKRANVAVSAHGNDGAGER
jgi:uncharacterized membrane protein